MLREDSVFQSQKICISNSKKNSTSLNSAKSDEILYRDSSDTVEYD
jgi:hypothetical protein